MKTSFLKNGLLPNITAEYKCYNLRKNSLEKRLIERDINEITMNYIYVVKVYDFCCSYTFSLVIFL